MINGSSANSAFNYLNNGLLSYDPYADNCPSYVYYSDGDCRIDANYKLYGLNDAVYGNNSRCFMGTFFKNGNSSFYDTHFTNAACFQSQVF